MLRGRKMGLAAQTPRDKYVQIRSRTAAKRSLLPTALLSLLLTTAVAPNAQAQSEDASTDLNTVQLVQSQDTGTQRLQSLQENATRPDSGQEIQNVVVTAAVHIPSFDYLWFLLQLPGTYDSNAGFAPSGEVASDRFDPKLQMNFSKSFFDHRIQFTDISAYDVDRYARDNKTAAETFQSIVQINYFSGGPPFPGQSVFVPYLWYQPTFKYDSTFVHRLLMQNDVGAGLGYKGSTEGWAVSLDLNLTERYTEPTTSTSLWIRAGALRAFGDSQQYVIQFAPNFRLRWYDRVAGFARQDETLVVPLIIEWDPKFLQSTHFLGDIQLSLFYAKNFSNEQKYAYEQWNNGPVPELSAVAYQ
jgi:hypothetical protein